MNPFGHTHGRVGAVIVFALLPLVGAAACKDKVACEQSRIATAEAWGEVKANAIARKLDTRRDGKPLSDDQLYDNVELWTELERQADMLESSFRTPQITWRPAERALAAMDERFSRVGATDSSSVIQAFKGLLGEAEAAQARADGACR